MPLPFPEVRLPDNESAARARSNHHDRMEDLRRLEAEAEAGGGPERREREHKAGKLTARERIHLLLDEGTFEELDKFVAPSLHGFRHGGAASAGRRIRHRLWPHRRPPGLRFRAGFHCFWRLAVRGQRAENLQDHGPGDERRRAGHWAQRFRRRAHSGRRGVARRLRGYFSAQHAGQRRGPADQRDHGPVRRRRGLFAGDHRFHLHDARNFATCS